MSSYCTRKKTLCSRCHCKTGFAKLFTRTHNHNNGTYNNRRLAESKRSNIICRVDYPVKMKLPKVIIQTSDLSSGENSSDHENDITQSPADNVPSEDTHLTETEGSGLTRKYKCDLCGEEPKTLISLKRHLLTHTTDTTEETDTP